MNNDDIVHVSIMGRQYPVRCSSMEAKALHQSAKYLEKQMRKVSQSAQPNNTDRVAVVTALNLAHELLKERATNEKSNIDHKVRQIRTKIQNALAVEDTIEV